MPTSAPTPDFRALWREALPFQQFVEVADPKHRDLWEGIYRTTRVPAELVRPLPEGEVRRLLVIAADWCGDACNTIAAVARWVEQLQNVELRILDRDTHPGLMDRYLTKGARSIPIVIVLDGEFRELGHWGPRPAELQAWVLANKDTMPREERYKEIRRWYARDRGYTTLRDLAGIMWASGENPADGAERREAGSPA